MQVKELKNIQTTLSLNSITPKTSVLYNIDGAKENPLNKRGYNTSEIINDYVHVSMLRRGDVTSQAIEWNSIIAIKNKIVVEDNIQTPKSYYVDRYYCYNRDLKDRKERAEKFLIESGIPYENLILYKENQAIDYIISKEKLFNLNEKIIIEVVFYSLISNNNDSIYKVAIVFIGEDLKIYKIQNEYNSNLKIDECKTEIIN